MSQLHEIVMRIDGIIADKGLPAYKTKGEIALRAGFILSWVNASTPDDPVKIQKLKAAAAEILKTPV
jgi:hypothetical protein